MLLESIDSRSILIRLPLDSSSECPSTEYPLALGSKSSVGQTILPSAVLATDTFRFQKHFPWSESVTAAHPGFPPPSQFITSKSPYLSIYFDPLLNLGLCFPLVSNLCPVLFHSIHDPWVTTSPPRAFTHLTCLHQYPLLCCFLFLSLHLPRTSQLGPRFPRV